MPDVTLTIPSNRVDRVGVAVAKQMGVSATDFGAMTGAQKLALVKSFYKQVTVDAVKAYELPTAEATAIATQQADIDTNITSQIT